MQRISQRLQLSGLPRRWLLEHHWSHCVSKRKGSVRGSAPSLPSMTCPAAECSDDAQGETEQIGKLLEQTMLRKVGPAALKDHFMLMDTICDATQERQDAVTDLVSRQEQVPSYCLQPAHVHRSSQSCRLSARVELLPGHIRSSSFRRVCHLYAFSAE